MCQEKNVSGDLIFLKNTGITPKFDVTNNVGDKRYLKTQKMWALTRYPRYPRYPLIHNLCESNQMEEPKTFFLAMQI